MLRMQAIWVLERTDATKEEQCGETQRLLREAAWQAVCKMQLISKR